MRKLREMKNAAIYQFIVQWTFKRSMKDCNKCKWSIVLDHSQNESTIDIVFVNPVDSFCL